MSLLNLKLNQKIFDKDVEASPIRMGFGEGLLEAGKKDKRVVALCADLTDSTYMYMFKKEFPDRFIEMGVAEQNLAATASGMAAMGKVPFISSYAMFSPGRNWEQIRTTIAYNNRKVIIVGSHAGVSVGADGGTHQAIEDIALMRVVPRMTVITPCDAIEAKKATLAALASPGSVYIRLQREKTPVITTEETPFEIGKANILYASAGEFERRVGIIACGALVYNALLAAKQLEEKKIGVTVLNMATIKPIDREKVLVLAKETHALVTVEEHQIVGGLGSAVAEFLSANHPTKIVFVGIKDEFGQSGKPDELIEHYGMGVGSIVNAAKEALKKD